MVELWSSALIKPVDDCVVAVNDRTQQLFVMTECYGINDWCYFENANFAVAELEWTLKMKRYWSNT